MAQKSSLVTNETPTVGDRISSAHNKSVLIHLFLERVQRFVEDVASTAETRLEIGMLQLGAIAAIEANTELQQELMLCLELGPTLDSKELSAPAVP